MKPAAKSRGSVRAVLRWTTESKGFLGRGCDGREVAGGSGGIDNRGVLEALALTSDALPGAIYPAFPALSFIYLVLRFTDVHWGWHRYAVRWLWWPGMRVFTT